MVNPVYDSSRQAIDDELARNFYAVLLERIKIDKDFRQSFLKEFSDYDSFNLIAS